MEAMVNKPKGDANGAIQMQPLGDVFQPSRPRVSPADKPDLPFIGMEHVEAHTMKLLGTVPAGTMKSSSVHFQPGDVLYGRLRPYLNKVCRPDFEGLCSAEFIVFPNGPDIDTKYLQYFLNSYDFVSFATHLNEGDRPRVDFKQIAPYPFPIAPLPQQRRIVSAIELQLGRLDTAVARLHAAKAKLKRYKQAVLNTSFPTEEVLPKGWSWKRIGDLGQVSTGSTPKRTVKKYWEGGNIPWVTSGALNSPFVEAPSGLITQVAIKETNCKLFPRHTILVALYGEGRTRGMCSELLIEAATNQAVAAILLPNEPALRNYVKWFMRKKYDDLRLLSIGGVQPNLNLSAIRDTAIPIPPTKSQEETVRRIELQLDAMDEMESTLDTQLFESKCLRQAVLKRAFEGRLV